MQYIFEAVGYKRMRPNLFFIIKMFIYIVQVCRDFAAANLTETVTEEEHKH